MPIIETVVIRRRVPIDPAAPVIPRPDRAWEDDRYYGGEIRRVTDLVPPTVPSDVGNGTVPAGNSIPGTLNQLAGPYAFPISEIGIGTFFAVTQIQHVFERVMPGAAQLWRADGSGPIWHIVAALAGLAAAIHGISSVVKLVRAKKKPAHI